MTTNTLRVPQDKGWATASTAGGLVILLLVVIWGASKWEEYWQNRDWQVSAATVTRFTQAVRAYTGRYYETLLNSATTTTPVIVTPTMLKNTGFLEPGFNETISSGQKLTASLVRNSTNMDQLQALIVSQGGVELPYMAVRDISVSVSTGLGAYLWGSDSVITGANASWTLPLATFGVATSSGHIASLLTTDDLNAARQDTDRLYRFSVTGKPDLNRMHTSIDMGENDLNNTGTVNAQTGQFSDGVTAGGDIRSTDGTLVTRGSKGWTNETHQGGFYMSDDNYVRSLNDKGIATGGKVQAGTVGLGKIAAANTSCPQNGDLARDTRGALLNCRDLVWKYLGSTVNLGAGIIDYGTHMEEFGTIYQIPDDSCVVASYPQPMSTVFAINVSIVNNKNTAGGEISSAYATKLSPYQFQVCVKNKGFTASQDVEWRAVGVPL